jgi:hypothetical protein
MKKNPQKKVLLIYSGQQQLLPHYIDRQTKYLPWLLKG